MYLIVLIIISIFIGGCVENNKVKYIYGNATIEDFEIKILESAPVEGNITVRGYLPDVCTEIDKIDTKREKNVFYITIRTIRPEDAICENELYFFEKAIPLNARELSPGVYYVMVNGMNGSFEIRLDSNLSK